MDKDEIRAIRKKLRLSQEALSRKLNCSWITVQRWESGKNEPKPEMVEKINALVTSNNKPTT